MVCSNCSEGFKTGLTFCVAKEIQIPHNWHHCGFWLISGTRILHLLTLSHSTDADFKFRSEPNTVFFFPHEECTSQKLNYFFRASSCITESGLTTFSVPLFRVKSGLGIVFLIHMRWISCYRKKELLPFSFFSSCYFYAIS